MVSKKNGRKTRSKKNKGGGPTMSTSKYTRKQTPILLDKTKQETLNHVTIVSNKTKDPKHWENRNKYYKKR